MNWLDIAVITILIFAMIKGFRTGLIGSIFNILRIILSVAITKRYYSQVSMYIINSPRVYNIFEALFGFILNILFYSKNKEDPGFTSKLVSKGLVNIMIILFAIILVYWLSNKLITLVFGLFSHIMKAPVLKQLNMIGGILFGLIEGLFIVYLLNLIISPIAIFFPESFMGRGISNSVVFDYLKEINQMFNIFENNKYI
ncbi:MAG: CvpA family protein [Tissierellia bacterium]|nr:CvpA family protein [Tissierellia bacterium]